MCSASTIRILLACHFYQNPFLSASCVRNSICKVQDRSQPSDVSFFGRLRSILSLTNDSNTRGLRGVYGLYGGNYGGLHFSAGFVCWTAWTAEGGEGSGSGRESWEAGPQGGSAVGHTGPLEVSAAAVGPVGPYDDAGGFALHSGSGPTLIGIASSEGSVGEACGVEVGAGEQDVTIAGSSKEAPSALVRRTSHRLALTDSTGIMHKAMARKAGLLEDCGAAATGVRASGPSTRRTIKKSRRCGVRLDEAQADDFEAFVRSRA